jgi:RNA polymerase sigma-70 factor (ECF subfamily)
LSVTDTTAERYAHTDPDVRLMLRVREDDAEAFELLVSRYQDRLLTVLQHLLGSPEQAEDLAQEVFLRVYRARKSYVPGAKFSTWMFTIANNLASNARRSLARRREINLQPADSGALGTGFTLDQLAKESSGMMPTRQLDKAETAQIVQLAMKTLNDRQRMAVLLSKFEDMSYAEIAETMGLTDKAVKSLLSRARANLRIVIEPYLDEGKKPQGTNHLPKAGG